MAKPVKITSLIKIQHALTDIPVQLLAEMKSWNTVVKSPYGNSFYNTDKLGWNFKEDGSLRISDHWNFYARGKSHCETTTEVLDNTHYTLAKYNTSLNKYEVICSIPKDYKLKSRLKYKLYILEIKRNLSLSIVKKDRHIKDTELRYLNEYYKILENYSKIRA